MNSGANRPFYLRAWGHVLRDWLRWPEERISRWEKCFDSDLDDRGSPLFYHESAMWYLMPLLIPDDLAAELFGKHTREGPNDYLALCWRLQKTIENGAIIESDEKFDWNAARKRAETVLQEYGRKFPPPTTTTEYEKRIVERLDV